MPSALTLRSSIRHSKCCNAHVSTLTSALSSLSCDVQDWLAAEGARARKAELFSDILNS